MKKIVNKILILLVSIALINPIGVIASGKNGVSIDVSGGPGMGSSISGWVRTQKPIGGLRFTFIDINGDPLYNKSFDFLTGGSHDQYKSYDVTYNVYNNAAKGKKQQANNGAWKKGKINLSTALTIKDLYDKYISVFNQKIEKEKKNCKEVEKAGKTCKTPYQNSYPKDAESLKNALVSNPGHAGANGNWTYEKKWIDSLTKDSISFTRANTRMSVFMEALSKVIYSNDKTKQEKMNDDLQDLLEDKCGYELFLESDILIYAEYNGKPGTGFLYTVPEMTRVTNNGSQLFTESPSTYRYEVKIGDFKGFKTYDSSLKGLFSSSDPLKYSTSYGIGVGLNWIQKEGTCKCNCTFKENGKMICYEQGKNGKSVKKTYGPATGTKYKDLSDSIQKTLDKSFKNNASYPDLNKYAVYLFAKENKGGMGCCDLIEYDKLPETYKKAYNALCVGGVSSTCKNCEIKSGKLVCPEAVNGQLTNVKYTKSNLSDEFKKVLEKKYSTLNPSAAYAFAPSSEGGRDCCSTFNEKDINKITDTSLRTKWLSAYKQLCDKGVPDEPNCGNLNNNVKKADVNNCCTDSTKSKVEEYGFKEMFCKDESLGINYYSLKDNTDNFFKDTDIQLNPYCDLYCSETVDVEVPGSITAISGRYFKLTKTSRGTSSPYIEGSRRCMVRIKRDQWEKDYESLLNQQVDAFNKIQENLAYAKMYEEANEESATVSKTCKGLNEKGENASSSCDITYKKITFEKQKYYKAKVVTDKSGHSYIKIESADEQTVSSKKKAKSGSVVDCTPSPSYNDCSSKLPEQENISAKLEEYKNKAKDANDTLKALANKLEEMENNIKTCNTYFTNGGKVPNGTPIDNDSSSNNNSSNNANNNGTLAIDSEQAAMVYEDVQNLNKALEYKAYADMYENAYNTASTTTEEATITCKRSVYDKNGKFSGYQTWGQPKKCKVEYIKLDFKPTNYYEFTQSVDKDKVHYFDINNKVTKQLKSDWKSIDVDLTACNNLVKETEKKETASLKEINSNVNSKSIVSCTLTSEAKNREVKDVQTVINSYNSNYSNYLNKSGLGDKVSGLSNKVSSKTSINNSLVGYTQATLTPLANQATVNDVAGTVANTTKMQILVEYYNKWQKYGALANAYSKAIQDIKELKNSRLEPKYSCSTANTSKVSTCNVDYLQLPLSNYQKAYPIASLAIKNGNYYIKENSSTGSSSLENITIIYNEDDCTNKMNEFKNKNKDAKCLRSLSNIEKTIKSQKNSISTVYENLYKYKVYEETYRELYKKGIVVDDPTSAIDKNYLMEIRKINVISNLYSKGSEIARRAVSDAGKFINNSYSNTGNTNANNSNKPSGDTNTSDAATSNNSSKPSGDSYVSNNSIDNSSKPSGDASTSNVSSTDKECVSNQVDYYNKIKEAEAYKSIYQNAYAKAINSNTSSGSTAKVTCEYITYKNEKEIKRENSTKSGNCVVNYKPVTLESKDYYKATLGYDGNSYYMDSSNTKKATIKAKNIAINLNDSNCSSLISKYSEGHTSKDNNGNTYKYVTKCQRSKIDVEKNKQVENLEEKIKYYDNIISEYSKKLLDINSCSNSSNNNSDNNSNNNVVDDTKYDEISNSGQINGINYPITSVNSTDNYKFKPDLHFYYSQTYVTDGNKTKTEEIEIPFKPVDCLTTMSINDSDLLGEQYSSKYGGKGEQSINRFKAVDVKLVTSASGVTSYLSSTTKYNKLFTHDAKYNTKCSWQEEDNKVYTLVPSGVISTKPETKNYTVHNKVYQVFLTSMEGSYETRWDITGLGHKGHLDNVFKSSGKTCSNSDPAEKGAFTCKLHIINQVIKTGQCNPTNPDNLTAKSSTDVTVNKLEITNNSNIKPIKIDNSLDDRDVCNPDDSSKVDIAKDGIQLFNFKTVDEVNVFPQGTETGGKKYAYNWTNTTSGVKALEEIQTRAKEDKTYAPENLTYSFTLTPDDMKAIKKYNESRVSNGGYADFELSCKCSEEKGDCKECYSTFITNFASGNFVVDGKKYGTWSNKNATLQEIRKSNNWWEVKQ